MKIAILGSAGSLPLHPSDPSWAVWGCSPGVYPLTTRITAWFELHRWEPGIVGKAHTQKQWFSPEYVQWMARLPEGVPVWMYDTVPEIPNSRRLPINDIIGRFGNYFLTSSISIMLACAIADILDARAANKAAGVSTLEPDTIGLWGVDMSANEEYGYQRAGCQHFLLIAADLGIQIYAPPESDLLRPMPVYGICESEWWHIKGTSHLRELQQRLANAQNTQQQAQMEIQFVRGAIDELQYQMLTWGESREGFGISPQVVSQMPRVLEQIGAGQTPKEAPPQPQPEAMATHQRHIPADKIEFGFAREKKEVLAVAALNEFERKHRKNALARDRRARKKAGHR